MLLGSALALPSLSQAAATCTIAPQTPRIQTGGQVAWSATYTGFSQTPRYSWTFGGGSPSSSTSSTRTVSYANAGTFTTSLRLSRGSTSATCTTSVTAQTQALSINDVTVTEGGAANFTVSLSAASSQTVTVRASTANDSAVAPGDYTARTNVTLTFAPGVTTQTFAVTTINDTVVESTEKFKVNLSSATNATINDSEGVGTINDNDTAAQASLSINDVSVTEGQTASFTVTLSPAATAQVRVNYATANGTAGLTDYSAASGTLTFQPGITSQPITVPTINDTAVEQTETFFVNLNAATGATIGDGQGVGSILDNDSAVPNTSINSTSQSSVGRITSVVPQQPQVSSPNYSVLAINDLGMHCGDLDTRIASILPPFQVLLSQVILKGTTPQLNPAGVSLFYSAVANSNDPILSRTVRDGVADDGSTYKNNFWDTVAAGSYDPFYPAYNPFVGAAASLTPLAGPPFNVTADTGLPVPNVEKFYIGTDGVLGGNDRTLEAVLHAMPGQDAPYSNLSGNPPLGNAPQLVEEHYTNKPFFTNFAFGYVAANVNWFEGAGIPFSAFDDVGRENAYPLVRVQAKNAGGTVLSTVDTVLPISGEASCTNCHADPADVQNSRTAVPTNTLLAAQLPVVTSIEDTIPNMPSRVSVEWAADINVLRLHDLKHGAHYVSTSCDTAGENCLSTAADPCTIDVNIPDGSPSCLTNKALRQNKPVVCQVCHYTPALDLAQLGPLAGATGTIANGRNQVGHQSNSRVMHNHHGQLNDQIPGLFPPIDPPDQLANGTIFNQGDRLAALENSCYQCHPGTNTKCLRGAMFNGGMLCSDCHGNMDKVGDDFSRTVSPSNAGTFILAKDFYTNPATPRVPWANEPGCGSCHTGDAVTRLTGTNLIVNTVDSNNNTDGIRLRQAFRTDDTKATPIVPADKRFAEPVVPATFNGTANKGAGNPQLYRVSTGHGGVMCEGCHGATHAEWPNANPNANDNVTSNQLQGHTGVVIECTTCHGTTMNSVNTLQGPHGMHPVGSNTSFADGGHKNMVSGNACVVCHGPNATSSGRGSNTGTVLSVAKAARNFSGLEHGGTVAKGKPVGCATCHD